MIIFILKFILFFHSGYSIHVIQDDSTQNRTVPGKNDIENRSDIHQPFYQYEYGLIGDETGDIKNLKEIRDGDYVKGQYHLKDPDGFIRSLHYIDKDKGYEATVTRHNGHHKTVHTIPSRHKMAHMPRWRRPPIVIEDHLKNNYMMQPYNFEKENTKLPNIKHNMIIDPIFKPLNMIEHSHQNSLIQPLKSIENYQQDNSAVQSFKPLEEHFEKNVVMQPLKFIRDPQQNNPFKLFSDNSQENLHLKMNDHKQNLKFSEDHRDNSVKLSENHNLDDSIVFPLKLTQNNSFELKEAHHQNNLIMQEAFKLIANPLMQPLKMIEHHIMDKPYEVVEHRYPKNRVKKFRRKVKKRPVVYYDNDQQHLTNTFEEPMKKLVMKKPPKGIYINHKPDPNYRLKDKYILPDSSSISSELGFFDTLSSMLFGDFSKEEKPVIVHRIPGGKKPSPNYNLNDVNPRKFVKKRTKYKVINVKDNFDFHNW